MLPERQRIVMLPEVRDELIRQLASRIHFSKVSHNSGPYELPTSSGGCILVVSTRIEVERVLERRDRVGDVAAETLKPLLHSGRGLIGRWSSSEGLRPVVRAHEDLVNEIVVGATTIGITGGPAFECGGHGGEGNEVWVSST